MTERPILFSGPMVRAILAGTKTQTRRELRGFCPPSTPAYDSESGRLTWLNRDGDDTILGMRCPYGQPGDRLWVREAFRLCAEADATKPRDTDAAYRIWYEADSYAGHWHQPGYGKLRPGIHMPRWASRITLEIVGVRVERLQDISEADARAEGCPCYVCGRTMDGLSEDDCHCFHRMAGVSDYRMLWESINGPGSWDANPWVWVVEFRRITP